MLVLDTNSHGACNVLEKPTKQRVWLLFVLIVAIVVAFLDRSNVSVLIANDAFLKEMGISGQPVKIGMIMSAFLFAYGFSNIILSPIGDYLGPRKTMMISIILWSISLFVAGLTSTFLMMIVMRIALGVGEGLQYPQQSVFIKKWFPPKERGLANAMPNIAQSLSLAMSMAIFAWIVSAYGWRMCFFACSVMSVIPLIILYFLSTDTPRQNKKVNKLELKYIEDALEEEAKQGNCDDLGTVWENLKLSIYNYRYWLVVIYHSCMNMILWGLVTWMPSYLKSQLGFTWAEMGALSSLPFVLACITKFISGWLSDRVGRRAPFGVVSMLATAICIYLSAHVVNHYAAAILLIIGLAISSLGTPTNWTLLQTFASGRAISSAAGLMNGIGFFFTALAPLAIGFFIGITGGYSGGLLFLVCMAMIAFVASLILALQKY